MFRSSEELKAYVIEAYPEITDSRIDEEHWDFECSNCRVTRGFQVTKREIAGSPTHYSPFDQDFDAPITYVFRCPVCKAFKQWIVYELSFKSASGHWEKHYFRVTSVPSEGLEEIEELPSDPPPCARHIDRPFGRWMQTPTSPRLLCSAAHSR